MLNIQKILIDACMAETKRAYKSLYGKREEHYVSVVQFAGRLALENVANCNTLYHNVEHTIMVNAAGQAILKGKQLQEGGVSPRDWLHFNIATFCHDIGFVPGICQLDDDSVFATGNDGETSAFNPELTDAQLAPWHVDRGKQFVRERFSGNLLVDVDAELICEMIEATRFPVPDSGAQDELNGLTDLVRGADLIGQLGDPRYLLKIPALYFEFMEIGKLEDMGYQNPDQMRRGYSGFYRDFIRPHISPALSYLRVTEEGRQWTAMLHSHVYDADRL